MHWATVGLPIVLVAGIGLLVGILQDWENALLVSITGLATVGLYLPCPWLWHRHNRGHGILQLTLACLALPCILLTVPGQDHSSAPMSIVAWLVLSLLSAVSGTVGAIRHLLARQEDPWRELGSPLAVSIAVSLQGGFVDSWVGLILAACLCTLTLGLHALYFEFREFAPEHGKVHHGLTWLGLVSVAVLMTQWENRGIDALFFLSAWLCFLGLAITSGVSQ